jgi:hypothetical protein
VFIQVRTGDQLSSELVAKLSALVCDLRAQGAEVQAFIDESVFVAVCAEKEPVGEPSWFD